MSAFSRTYPTAGRGMPEGDQYQDRQEKARIDVSPSLLNRIRFQRGKPDLDLSLCSLAKIPLDSIREHHGPETLSLNLSYNRIRSLPSKFISLMSCLQTLELSHNELKKLPDDFGELEHLVYLDISQNKLQKLPLSMGKMTRLQYLNIQENPFRPPLCDFLEGERRLSNDGHMAAAHTAQMVVNFLAKLAQETLVVGSGDHPPPIRRRGVTFENDNFEEEMEEEEDIINNNNVDSETYFGGSLRRDELCVDAEMAGGHHLLQMVDFSSPKEKKQKKKNLLDHICNQRWTNDTIPHVPLIGKTSSFMWAHRQLKPSESVWNEEKTAALVISLILLILAPLMIALVIEGSAMGEYAKDDGFTNYYWDKLKPIYEAAENGISWLTSRPILVRGPQGRPLNVNPFIAMLLAFQEALASMVQAIGSMFARNVHPVV